MPDTDSTFYDKQAVNKQTFIELEKQWISSMQSQDPALMDRFLTDHYFLAIGVQGKPLQVVPREQWLESLKVYKIGSFSIDDIQVHLYGTTAVVLMLYTQKATVRGQDRSGQLVITDIRVMQDGGWRIAERHSSRPEQPALVRPG